jgi:hypothetical protein
MAVTSITISQTNKTGNVDLLAVHNPLVFLVDVAYTSAAPETLYVELQDELGDEIETFAAIPYSDVGSIRTFAFIADDILRSYMESYADFESPVGTLEHVPNQTKQYGLRFYIDAIEATVEFVACHAARQFGEDPAMEDIYTNDDDTYYGASGKPVYAYIYNNSTTNLITIDSPTADEYALTDYDDTILIDHDNQYFKSL